MIRKISLQLILCIIVLLFLVLTQAGLNTLVEISQYFVPGKLRIHHASGYLLGPIKLEHVRFYYQDLHFKFDTVEFPNSLWRWWLGHKGSTAKLTSEHNHILLERNKQGDFHAYIHLPNLEKVLRHAVGNIQGQMQIGFEGDQPHWYGKLTGDLKLPNLTLTGGQWQAEGGQNFNLTIKQLETQQLILHTIQIQGQLEKSNDVKLSGQFSLAQLDTPSHHINAHQITSHWALHTTRRHPLAQYTLSFDNTVFDNHPLGLHQQLANGKLTGKAFKQWQWSANLSQPQGWLKLRGQTTRIQEGWSSKGKLQGHNFLMKDTPQAKIYADPELSFYLTPHQQDITGQITLPKASIKPSYFYNEQGPSNDILIAHSTPQQRSQKSLNIKLLMGRNVQFKGFGFSGKIQGELTLKKHANKPITATGVLTSEQASYKLYGKPLTLSSAKLIYSDHSLTNPALDISAHRRVRALQAKHDTNSMSSPDHYLITAHVTGSWHKPVIRLQATPPLQEADCLSYLLFDQPADQISLNQLQILLQAASQLQFKSHHTPSVNSVMEQLKESLELDEIDIRPTTAHRSQDTLDSTQPSLMVSKQLNRNLNLAYSIGLLSPINIFSIRYQVNKHLSLESELNSEGAASGDLIWRLEVE